MTAGSTKQFGPQLDACNSLKNQARNIQAFSTWRQHVSARFMSDKLNIPSTIVCLCWVSHSKHAHNSRTGRAMMTKLIPNDSFHSDSDFSTPQNETNLANAVAHVQGLDLWGYAIQSCMNLIHVFLEASWAEHQLQDRKSSKLYCTCTYQSYSLM